VSTRRSAPGRQGATRRHRLRAGRAVAEVPAHRWLVERAAGRAPQV